MTAARFPAHRDFNGFDFAQAQVDEGLMRQLQSLSFLEAAHNLVFIGGPGTGKTHLATALGIDAIGRHGKRVRFFSTIELVNALELEKAAGKQGQIAHRLMYVDLVILDELGYLPFSQAGGALLLSSAVETLRAHQRGDHYQPQLCGMAERVWRCQDDDGIAGPADPSLPHH